MCRYLLKKKKKFMTTKICFFFPTDFLKYKTFFAIVCVSIQLYCWKLAKLVLFFAGKYTTVSLKIGKIHIFFIVDFLQLVSYICNYFAKNLQILHSFHHWLLKNKIFLSLIFFFFFKLSDLLWKYGIVSSKIGEICAFMWLVFLIFLQMIL